MVSEIRVFMMITEMGLTCTDMKKLFPAIWDGSYIRVNKNT